MLLSKRRLWSCNQALHLEKIKKYNKRAKWIWNQSGLWWQCSASELLSCLCIPDLEGYLQSVPLDGQKLLNPYLRGKISNVQHPVWTQISGATFSWQVSHWPRHLFLPPLSWDSWFISWNSICSRSFFSDMLLHKRGSWKETAVLIPAGAAADTDSNLCTCMEMGDWRFVRGGNTLEYQDSEARGMDDSGGGQSDTPPLTWRSWDHTWLGLVKRIPGWGLVGCLGMKWLAGCSSS